MAHIIIEYDPFRRLNIIMASLYRLRNLGIKLGRLLYVSRSAYKEGSVASTTRQPPIIIHMEPWFYGAGPGIETRDL